MPINYKKYPPNWKTEIVPAVLARDRHKCKFCGVENGKTANAVILKIQDRDSKYKLKTFWFENESDFLRAKQFSPRETKKVKVVLTIAHLDHDETNHAVSFDRLAALCQYCHLNYDAKEKYRRARGEMKETSADMKI